MQSPELALPTPKPKAHLPERSHHWRPSRRQICIREPRSHPLQTTRNYQSGRALGRMRPPCCVGNAGEITQEVTSNSVKPAPPRLNVFRASPPPRAPSPAPGLPDLDANLALPGPPHRRQPAVAATKTRSDGIPRRRGRRAGSARSRSSRAADPLESHTRRWRRDSHAGRPRGARPL